MLVWAVFFLQSHFPVKINLYPIDLLVKAYKTIVLFTWGSGSRRNTGCGFGACELGLGEGT